MKSYPAVDIRNSDRDLAYAALDDFGPTAIEEHDSGLRAFFSSTDSRDIALGALSSQFDVSPLEVSDDDWARRCQEGLPPVTVGRITIVPNPERSAMGPVTIAIAPSMGFGTGHHATTRLCLAALQDLDLDGKVVLDVGTGSGVLAIAADRLGAARAAGIDVDPDAIESARLNLAQNPQVTGVRFEVADVADLTGADPALSPADVVTANLTGALIVRAAPLLFAATRSGGALVLSGLLRDERDAVCAAFPSGIIVWERQEDEWVGLAVKKP